MNVFKLQPGKHESFTLNSSRAFHTASSKRHPWFQEVQGVVRHYAVCPECDNPIQIINLDVDTKVDSLENNLPLYAKHVGKSIRDIADYDALAYDECSLANPKSFNGKDRRAAGSKVADDILRLLVEHADAVHYFVEKFLEADVPGSVFQSMLREFLVQQGYLYRAVTTSNVPFALLYMAGNQDLFTCRVRTSDSPLARAIGQSQHFELKGKYIGRKSKGGSLRFFVTGHSVDSAPEGNHQFMTLVVEEEIDGARTRLLTDKRELGVSHFRNTVDKRQRFRDMANEQFGQLLKVRGKQ